jgi:hypothetical protein
MTAEEAFHELCGYTLTLQDQEFIHQYVVDAFAAQTADESTKPIKLTFALVGLHLHLDRRYTGKHVQQVHQFLARRSREWPLFTRPSVRGSLTVLDVLAKPVGLERHKAIEAWCASVWEAYRASHSVLISLLRRHGIEP